MSAQQLFIGHWQTRTWHAIKIPAIDLSIEERFGGLRGTVKLANPDRTQFPLQFDKAEVRGNSVEFQTDDGRGWRCRWELKLAKDKRRGVLSAGCGEMLIEEKVTKRD